MRTTSYGPPLRCWLEPKTAAAEVFLQAQEHWEYSIEAVVYGEMDCNGEAGAVGGMGQSGQGPLLAVAYFILPPPRLSRSKRMPVPSPSQKTRQG
jgi:hypothetical protein